MELANLSDALQYLVPEIIITAVLLIIVLFDLIFHDDKRILPYIAVGGLFITGFVTGSTDITTPRLFQALIILHSNILT